MDGDGAVLLGYLPPGAPGSAEFQKFNQEVATDEREGSYQISNVVDN
ncbi:hypothetical protein [Sporosarcina gallistercoris]|uniref:Uncharacterized protein n=1 Tax=Sporosarcina gallistercoris TaxID=2762245 RepID=A0ABR8PMI9_9BACL|nr:hypothetical protein [Sporosarcina gallistercoris]MBD7909395.1 hypothetical protein [Sporosarcina gallistercoris]